MTQKDSISSSHLKHLLLSIIVFMGCTSLSAQEKKQEKQDSIPLFTGIEVYADAVGAVQSLISDYGQYEGGVRLGIRNKYFPVVEMGWGMANHHNEVTNIGYKTQAPYAKVGLDLNFMKNKRDNNRIYGGVRVAGSRFKIHYTAPTTTDPVWQTQTDINVDGVKAWYTWLEFVGGLDAHIWGPIRLGWTVRYQRRLMHNNGTLGNVWYVPGWGKADNAKFTATFNLIVEI